MRIFPCNGRMMLCVEPLEWLDMLSVTYNDVSDPSLVSPVAGQQAYMVLVSIMHRALARLLVNHPRLFFR